MSKKALMVVESEFLHVHVGVRRVIIHYIEALEQAGYTVDLGAPRDGVVYRMRIEDDARGGIQLGWTSLGIDPTDYATIIISNPWVCTQDLPELPGCIGIVYDLVPNMIALGFLRFANAKGMYAFARDHDVGFQYYLRNARRITCISESTRQDFLELYGPVREDLDVCTHIPFTVDADALGDGTGNRVLLVNALDIRKNLANMADILERAHAVTPLHVVIVGKERAAHEQILAFFQRLEAVGIPHEWLPEADDAQLVAEYQRASVLLFPSLYEGLGLPVLEAQSHGVPSITSNVSSLPEINLNPELCFAPDDTVGMAEGLVALVSGRHVVKRGNALRGALAERLAAQPFAVSVLT